MKNEYVYVVDKHGKPLMPTKNHCKVRHLLDEKKAVAIGNNPLVIRLKYDVSGYTQPIHEGIDTGRENIGDAASLEDGTNVYLADVRTNNKSIKKKMADRAGFRRERRRHDRQSKQRKAKHDGTEIQNGADDTVRTKHECKSKKVSYPGAENPCEDLACKSYLPRTCVFRLPEARERGYQTLGIRQRPVIRI